MLLYHGSYTEIAKPDINYGRYNLDFGKGFYVTSIKEQAEKWAYRRAVTAKTIQQIDDSNPVISVYDIDFDNIKLDMLVFDGYSEAWLDFVTENRGRREPAPNSKYDIICGNIADDDVAAVVDDYMRLLKKGRISNEDKSFFIRQLQYSKPNDQFCFVSEKSIQLLKFIKSYNVESNL